MSSIQSIKASKTNQDLEDKLQTNPEWAICRYEGSELAHRTYISPQFHDFHFNTSKKIKNDRLTAPDISKSSEYSSLEKSPWLFVLSPVNMQNNLQISPALPFFPSLVVTQTPPSVNMRRAYSSGHCNCAPPGGTPIFKHILAFPEQ